MTLHNNMKTDKNTHYMNISNKNLICELVSYHTFIVLHKQEKFKH